MHPQVLLLSILLCPTFYAMAISDASSSNDTCRYYQSIFELAQFSPNPLPSVESRFRIVKRTEHWILPVIEMMFVCLSITLILLICYLAMLAFGRGNTLPVLIPPPIVITNYQAAAAA